MLLQWWKEDLSPKEGLNQFWQLSHPTMLQEEGWESIQVSSQLKYWVFYSEQQGFLAVFQSNNKKTRKVIVLNEENWNVINSPLSYFQLMSI